MLDLNGVRPACWNLDSGHWRDISDKSVAEEAQVADTDTIRWNTAGHESDVLSRYVAPLDEAEVG